MPQNKEKSRMQFHLIEKQIRSAVHCTAEERIKRPKQGVVNNAILEEDQHPVVIYPQ